MKYFCYFFCFFIVLSCTEEINEPPASRETMLFVLRDMIIIEAQVSLLKDEIKDSVKLEQKNKLLSRYQWDAKQLEAFREYLATHPEISLELHDEVRSELKLLEGEL